MTLPECCVLCGYTLNPWDPDDAEQCWNCGAEVQPIERWSPAQRQRWMRQRAIDAAATVAVKGGVL